MATEFNLKLIIQALDRATAPARKIARGISAAMDRVSDAARRAGRVLARVADRVGRMGDRISSLGTDLSTTISGALSLLGGFAFRSSAQIETMTVAFESMLGSADRAREFVKRLTDFTARTPLQLAGVGASARSLLAVGVEADEVFDKLQVLGDIASGTETPLNIMASNFGKVRSTGKAMREEILQLSDRGIPIIAALAEEMGVAEENVLDLGTKGRIGFEIYEAALRRMTREGGKFFRQMEKQSRTLTGLISTLLDNLNLALGKVGDQLVKTFNVRERITQLTAFI
ncbi:MAG: tape measure protein, partial [Alphaproteobacteria bacterium]